MTARKPRKPRELRSDRLPVRTMICRDSLQLDMWGNSVTTLAPSQADQIARNLSQWARWQRSQKEQQ